METEVVDLPPVVIFTKPFFFIAPEDLKRIFDPYFTTQDVVVGSGMELAMVVGFVRGCNEMITVKSTPGKGTTLNVYFPKSKEQQPMEGVSEEEPLPTGSEKILIVDDEESIAFMTKTMVERLGYKATASTSSVAALELFSREPNAFDLVVTDQTMPEVTGEQLTKSLRNINSALPIILCSGYNSKIDSEKALQSGLNAFLMKPVSYRELAKTIRQVLDKR